MAGVLGVDGEVAISVEGVTKSYDGAAAVREVTLAIGRGEFFSLLGPSGCGKTTTLRMVAGFVTPDSGRIVLAGRDVTGVPANRRPVNMVFQHYALFPHMTVYDNVAFGLKMKKAPRSTHRARVQEILDVVELEGFERRHIRHLSGGQQQRVALARALVNRPEALLLDEPLGALDVKLRRQMQLELKRIQHDLGTTFVYVTHDQEEALAMSDRIAVMNAGVVEQIGTPRELYEHPQSAFAADFIGSLNVLDAVVGEVRDGRALIRLGERSRIVVPVGRNVHSGDTVKVAVRPERVRLTLGAAPADEECALEGTVAQVVFLGMYTQYHVDTQGGMLLSHRLSDDPIEPGSRVTVAWDPDQAATL